MTRAARARAAVVLAAASAACAACNQRDRVAPIADRSAAVDACLLASRQARARGAVAPLPEACTRLVVDRGCRRALSATADAMIAACAPAYCTHVAAPPPAACTADGAAASVDREAAAGALFGAIVAYDLGVAPGSSSTIAAAYPHRSPRTVAPPAPGNCAQRLTVSLGASRATTALTGGAPHVIDPCGGALDRAALIAEVCAAVRAAPCTPAVELDADSHASYADVMTVIDAGRAAGATQFSFETGSPPSSPAGAGHVTPRCGDSVPSPVTCP